MGGFSIVVFIVCLVIVTGNPLFRSLRSIQDLIPVDECKQIVGPVRCEPSGVGYQDADVLCCNGTKCNPPTTQTSQETDNCTEMCLNGGTANSSNLFQPCLCPEGFAGRYCENVALCGELYLDSEGIIEATFPGLSEELRCVYEIRTDAEDRTNGLPGKRIILSAEEFQVHPLHLTEEDLKYRHTSCPENNRVSVYQDKFEPGYQFRQGGYCGTDSFQTIVSDSNVIFVEVIYAGNNKTNTLRLRYRTVINERRHFCEESWGIQSEQGKISSPGYPLQHPSLMQCFWVIYVQTGYTIQLNFTSVDLQEPDIASSECYNDQLMLLADRDGDFRSFCGSHTDKNFVFENPGKVFILLFTDDLVQRSGFVMDFLQLPPPSDS